MMKVQSKKLAIAQHYDRNGRNAQHSNVPDIPNYLKAPYAYAYNFLEQNLPQGSQILDFGCGTGIHSFELAERGFKVTGVDLSPHSIQAAKLHTSKALKSSCLFLVGDENSPKLNGLRFDAIFMSGALYYLDLNTLPTWARKHLDTSGYLVAVETYAGNHLMNAYRNLKNIFFDHRDEQTLNNLLGKGEYLTLSAELVNPALTFFDFSTLVGATLARFPKFQTTYLCLATKLDQHLLKIAPSLAFKVVLTARINEHLDF